MENKKNIKDGSIIPTVKFSSKNDKSEFEKKKEIEILLEQRNSILKSMGYEFDEKGNIIKKPEKLRQRK